MKAASLGVASRFADADDRRRCLRLQRKHGTTYYFASRRFPLAIRERVAALYAFVRIPDEWVDNPGPLSIVERRERLANWREQLERGISGESPSHWGMRAFVDAVVECGLPLDEPLCFLRAMEADLETTRYATYEDLEGYMRGSASSVGLMMLAMLGASVDDEVRAAAIALGEAMQLTNFLRDVGEDMRRGRIYIPQEDLGAFEVSEAEIQLGVVSERWRRLAQFEIDRARALYARADAGIDFLPAQCRYAVRMARVLYSRILDRIEANQYDVFSRRARTSRFEKLIVAAQLR